MTTKLHVYMYRRNVIMPVGNCDNGIIDDVIISENKPNKSKFWTAVTSLFVKLESRVKALNVEEFDGYLYNMLNFR